MLPKTMKRMRPPDPRDGWYEITPAEAQWILDHGAKNRPLKESRARRYCADIKAGIFKPNGESAIFDERDRCVDGQHRMLGIVLAQKPAVIYCVFGVPSKYFASIDQGSLRSGGDIAGTMGFTNYSMVAAIAHLAIGYTDGSLASTGPSAKIPGDALRLYMERHRERLELTAAETLKHRTGIVRLVPISHAGFVYFMNPDAGRAMLDDFLEKLATGAKLHKGDALLLFRQRMLDLIGQKHQLTQKEKVAFIIKTWNAFRANRPLGALKWNSAVETFPQFVKVNEGAKEA